MKVFVAAVLNGDEGVDPAEVLEGLDRCGVIVLATEDLGDESMEACRRAAGLLYHEVELVPLEGPEAEEAEEETGQAAAAFFRALRELDEAHAEAERLVKRMAELEESAAMACVEPADGCECAGCLYAAEAMSAVPGVG